jgi:hypothetical protein
MHPPPSILPILQVARRLSRELLRHFRAFAFQHIEVLSLACILSAQQLEPGRQPNKYGQNQIQPNNQAL